MDKRIYAIIILVVYAFLVPAAAFGATKFFGRTVVMYNAPPDSIVGKTRTHAAPYFPTQILHNPLFILLTVNGNARPATDPAITKEVCAVTTALQDEVARRWASRVFSVTGYCLMPDVPELRSRTIGGANNASTLVVIDMVKAAHFSVNDGVRSDLEDFTHRFLAANASNLTAQFTSTAQISGDLVSGLVRDLMTIDAVSIPLAIAALAYCLRSIRFLIIPGVAIPVTICIAFGLSSIVTYITDVSSFAPEMASATMIAISIDYSLFLLSRFAERVKLREAEGGEDTIDRRFDIVMETTRLTAHNIVVSGMTVAVALGGLAILPVPLIATIGYVFFISACSAVVVSLTLTPALLMIGYGFFRYDPCMDMVHNACAKCCGSKGEKDLLGNEEADEESRLIVKHYQTVTAGGEEEAEDPALVAEREGQASSWWFRIGLFTFRHPYAVVVVLCLLGAPLMWQCSKIAVDFSIFEQVPRDSPHGRTLKTLSSEIGHSATPFYVTIVANETGAVVDRDIVNTVATLREALVKGLEEPEEHVVNPVMFPTYFLFPTSWEQEFSRSQEFAFLWNRTTDTTLTATMIQVYPRVSPFSPQANGYLNTVKKIIDAQPDGNGRVTFGLMGGSADSWAIMHTVFDYFPLQIGVTFGVIFVFVGAVFRSVFIPLRMIFTVAFTVSVAGGLGVVFFQYPWSHGVWTAMDGVESYSWTVPIFAFSLLCALALDYDVFLLTRLVEFKAAGFTDEAAIAKSVWKTGRIITFAGVIMSISFGSLMVSNITMLNQFGMVAVFAVVLDTFVVRTFFVPALMSVWPAAAWWPRRFLNLERPLSDMGLE